MVSDPYSPPDASQKEGDSGKEGETQRWIWSENQWEEQNVDAEYSFKIWP